MSRRLICVLAAVLLAVPAPALAQGDETPGENLGGYDAMSSAVAFSFQPFLPAFVSTGDVPFEASFALSTSRVKSGGGAFGRGALVWPGSAAANLGPILGVAFDQPELGALIPPWPLVAEATQDDGEVVTGQPPAIAMTATGQKDRASGDVRLADGKIPRVIHIENIASTATSVVTDSSVTSTGRIALHGVTLLAGYITIEEIRSRSVATSIGGAASTSGDVDIIGMKIGGIDVSVTDEGFQVGGFPPDAQDLPGAGGEPAPGQSPEDVVNAILESLGARITLFKSVSTVSGGKAERTAPGMIVSIDNPAGGVDRIPPGRFDIIIAATSASSLSTLPFNADLGDIGGALDSLPGDTSSGGGGSISLGDGPEVAGDTVSNVEDELSDAGAGPLGDVPQSLDDVTQRSDRYEFGGLPLGLVFGLLLLAALLARYVRNFFRSMLAGAAQRNEETTT